MKNVFTLLTAGTLALGLSTAAFGQTATPPPIPAVLGGTGLGVSAIGAIVASVVVLGIAVGGSSTATTN